jgi:hypothetical protein
MSTPGCEADFSKVPVFVHRRFRQFTGVVLCRSPSFWYAKTSSRRYTRCRCSEALSGNWVASEAIMHGLPFQSNPLAMVQLCGACVLVGRKRCASWAGPHESFRVAPIHRRPADKALSRYGFRGQERRDAIASIYAHSLPGEVVRCREGHALSLGRCRATKVEGSVRGKYRGSIFVHRNIRFRSMTQQVVNLPAP